MKNLVSFLLLCLVSTNLYSQSSSRPHDGLSKGKVLIIVSNSLFQGDSKLAAGNSFSEVIIAYDVFKKAGYQIDFVSPNGGLVPLSYINTSNSLQRSYLFNCDFMFLLKYTKKPSEITASDYQIVHYTGGSSPIFDIPSNQSLQDIVMSIYENNNGIISAVCHGTAGIVHLKTKDGKYLVNGKKVNGVPDSQESKELPHYQHYPFIIQTVMEERGGDFHFSKIGTAHMEVDGRLVTGQNSLSSKMVALKSIELAEQLNHKYKAMKK